MTRVVITVSGEGGADTYMICQAVEGPGQNYYIKIISWFYGIRNGEGGRR